MKRMCTHTKSHSYALRYYRVTNNQDRISSKKCSIYVLYTLYTFLFLFISFFLFSKLSVHSVHSICLTSVLAVYKQNVIHCARQTIVFTFHLITINAKSIFRCLWRFNQMGDLNDSCHDWKLMCCTSIRNYKEKYTNV